MCFNEGRKIFLGVRAFDTLFALFWFCLFRLVSTFFEFVLLCAFLKLAISDDEREKARKRFARELKTAGF